MTLEEFEKEVEEALKTIPSEFRERLKNIEIDVDDSAPKRSGSLLLGQYNGVPLNNRSAVFEPMMPDKITLFKPALEMISKNTEELKKNIRDTIVHEIGHYFGFNEKDIRKRGF